MSDTGSRDDTLKTKSMSFPFDFYANIDTFKAMLFISKANTNAKNSIFAYHIAVIEPKVGRIIQLENFLTDFKRGLYRSKFKKGHPDRHILAL